MASIQRVLAVNIRAGGTLESVRVIVRRALERDCDTVVFSEYRNNDTGKRVAELLHVSGYANVIATPHKGNGVLIGSRCPFHPILNPFGLSADEYPHAVVEANFDDGVRLFGVYLPGQDRKRPHLRCIIATAQYCNENGIDVLCIGDFNSGRNETDIEANIDRQKLRDAFSTADLYAELELYWTEAWLYCNPNQQEFSWYPFRRERRTSRRNGWRIDKAFVSRSLLPRLLSAEYDHTFRTEGLTDHSALVISLAPVLAL